jgi:Mn-dependent DtxR family transcriptional regulator
MARPLSPKQQACLDVVTRWLFEYGFPPSLAEIAEELKIAKPTAQSHVGKLLTKGVLHRIWGRLMLSPGDNPHEMLKAKGGKPRK